MVHYKCLSFICSKLIKCLADYTDKHIQNDNEYSDSEDEGEGGRRNEEDHKPKKKKAKLSLKQEPSSEKSFIFSLLI